MAGFALGISQMAFLFVNHLSGNERRTRGQLEDLSGQRKEEQGEEKQDLPQATKSKDGTEGMMV